MFGSVFVQYLPIYASFREYNNASRQYRTIGNKICVLFEYLLYKTVTKILFCKVYNNVIKSLNTLEHILFLIREDNQKKNFFWKKNNVKTYRKMSVCLIIGRKLYI